MQPLQEQIRDMCMQYCSTQFRNTYSGRGMYGKQCVGIVGNQKEIGETLAAIIKSMNDSVCSAIRNAETDDEHRAADDLQDQFDRSVNTLMNYDQDTMGWDIIVYWPNLSPIEDYDEEDEDD